MKSRSSKGSFVPQPACICTLSTRKSLDKSRLPRSTEYFSTRVGRLGTVRPNGKQGLCLARRHATVPCGIWSGSSTVR